MKRKIITNVCFVTSVFILLGLNSCNFKTESQSDEGLTRVSIRQEWFPYSGFVGELFAMNETDSIYGLDIILESGSENVDPVKMVIAGSNDFGVAPSNRIIAANQKGANLVVIGVIHKASPVCFLGRKKLKIEKPADFEGKKVGVITGVQSELVYKTLMKKANVDRSKIREVEIPFGLETFIAGNYDIRPAFINNETLSLDEKGIEYTIIKPEDFNVNFIGSVYFTTQKMVEENPDLVQAVINSLADAWKLALDNPEKGIEYLKAYDNSIDKKRELKSFLLGIPYYTGNEAKPLLLEKERWNEMIIDLQEIGEIKTVDLDALVNNTFIKRYYINH